MVIVVLDRPRHQKLIADIRDAGARIRLISDGDLARIRHPLGLACNPRLSCNNQ